MDTVRVALGAGLMLIGLAMAAVGIMALGEPFAWFTDSQCSTVAAYDAHGAPVPIISHDC